MSIRPAYNPPIISAKEGGTGFGPGSPNPLVGIGSGLLYGDGSAQKLQALQFNGAGTVTPTVLRRGLANLVRNRRSGRVRVAHNSVSTQVSTTSAAVDIVSVTLNKRYATSRVIVIASISGGKTDRADLVGAFGLTIARDNTNIYSTGQIFFRNATAIASPNNTRIGMASTATIMYEDPTPLTGTGNTTYKITGTQNGSLTTFFYQWGGAPSSITVLELIEVIS